MIRNLEMSSIRSLSAISLGVIRRFLKDSYKGSVAFVL
jgi:hypothetical protein